MAVFGLDFGTTNSLAAYVEGDQAVALLDRQERPHPSVVQYHGTECVVGRDAKAQLSERTGGIVGDIVRSPKRFLATGQSIPVAGRTLRPAEVVAEIFQHLRRDARSRGLTGREFDRAVVTIPIHLPGQGREELREAANAAGIRVDQFVHEPFAALYGHLRPQADFDRQLAALRDQVVLVFDWGGGTLDLTLCRFERGTIVQIQNLGNDLIGGDRFDERLLNFVKKKHEQAHGLTSWPGEGEGARARLLEECELAKIELSRKSAHTIFVRNCLRIAGPARDLHVTISRDELVSQTADLVHQAAATVDRLLSSADQKDTGVAFCLATGGMVRMPYVREQLQQRFGLSRVRIAEHGDRIIAQGAAWIANDQHRLCLAKPFEILDADDTYVPIIHAGQALPVEGQTTQIPIHFYCVDPRDGIAKLQFARPKQPSRVQPAHPRQIYTTLTLRVDPRAQPLVERLAVNLTIDENLIVNVSAQSTVRRDRVEAAIHDLEFGLRLDGRGKLGPAEDTEEGHAANAPRRRRGTAVANPTAVALRSNVVRHRTRTDLVPGEMITWNTQSFLTDRQRQEHEYYLPCCACHRLIYEIQRDGCTNPCLAAEVLAD